MSHSTNSNINFCEDCDLSFEIKKGLYKHQSNDSKNKDLLDEMFGSDDDVAITETPAETIERMYDSDDELI